MSNRIKVLLPLLLALTLILVLQVSFLMMPDNKPSVFHTKKLTPLEQAMQLIRSNYVDTVGLSNLDGKAIDSMVAKLDPHTAYLPPTDEAEVHELIHGNFGGIGVEFFVIRDTVWVIDVVKGGPSHQAGIYKGDQIIAVNDTSIAGNGVDDNDIYYSLRGPAGTKVKLTLVRGKQLITARLTRGKIPSPSLGTAYMIDHQTGYIKLDRFSGTTYNEFIDAMDDLKSKGLKKLILDLRGNGGGLLDEATAIADEFIDQGKVIVYTKGRAYGKEEFKSRVLGAFEEGALEVLVDEGSASASEVIAGALQDYDRALIIGRRTFGKGLVQQQYKLNNGGYLRLTIARYYTPSGRSIQKPYKNGDHLSYYHEVYDRTEQDTTMAYADTTRYFTSLGRPMRGSGGIMPDIVVEDSITPGEAFDYITTGYRNLPEIAYTYASKNFEQLKAQFPTPDSFMHSFEVPASLLDTLAMDLSGKKSSFRTSYQDDVALRLKAFIGRYMFDRSVLYRLLAHNDKIYQRAVKEMQDPRFAFTRTAP